MVAPLTLINAVNHVTFVVTDLDRSLAYYQQLGFRPRARWRRGVYMEAGAVWLCLELGAKVAPHGEDDSHVAFDVSEITENVRSLPRWKENKSEGASLYLVDPDGHKIELHVGSLESRLSACRAKPYDDMEFFD